MDFLVLGKQISATLFQVYEILRYFQLNLNFLINQIDK